MLNPPLVQLLTASIIAGVIGLSGFFLSTTVITSPVEVSLEPKDGILVIGETFVVTIVVKANLPVNVFKGLLTFDPEKLSVASIDYNTSIANLWAEEPWYSNGDGTINFTGGTTMPGGFVGQGSLITITFNTKTAGEASLTMTEMRVLKHDGFGTDVELPTPIDALFAVESEAVKEKTVFENELPGPVLTIIPEAPQRDLSGDGRQSIADVSIFMTHLLSQNLRSDFSGDGKVDLKDLSILNGD